MDINNSSEDIEQILLNNLTDEDGNTPYYLRGEQIYESNFADEIEKTREDTRQLFNNPEQSDIHLNNVFKEPILNQETQLGKKSKEKNQVEKQKMIRVQERSMIKIIKII